MTHDTRQIIDDVQAMRDELPAPHRRRYALRTKSDHIRLSFDEDVSLTFNVPIEKLQHYGYEFDGANFDSKFLVFEPEGDSNE